MLQPLQLKEVAERYGREIAEMRDFLASTDVPVGTDKALRSMTDRLSQDRAFHRDVTSYLWALLHAGNGDVGIADLLGVLVLAGAGSQLASAADERDTLPLLRSVMEARRSFDAASALEQISAVESNKVQPVAVEDLPLAAREQLKAAAPAEQHEIFDSPAVSDARPVTRGPIAPTSNGHFVMDADEPRLTQQPRLAEQPLIQPSVSSSVQGKQAGQRETRRRQTMLWTAVAACLLAVLLAGLWLFQRSGSLSQPATISTTPAPASRGTARPSEMAGNTGAEPSSAEARQEARQEQRQADSKTEMRRASRSKAESRSTAKARPGAKSRPGAKQSATHGAGTTAEPFRLPSPASDPPTQQQAAATPAPVVREAATNSSAAPVAAKAVSPRPGNPAVPATVLSSRVGSSTIPAYSDADPKHPILHRRNAPASESTLSDNSQLPDRGRLMAMNHAPVPPASASAADVAPRGIVRSTALGVMAGNVIYSPTPAYPPEATASHTQGTVTIRAQIDRQGNVAAARVISGPPQLRDAAVDAVQRWRYKPYLSGGKPAPTAATVVMDFELP